jgi:predicted ATP-grasp superfamily ATP-dependent carboligase
MNLLVTNTRHSQAYAVIQSLRKHANKIIATVYGKTRWIANLSSSSNSRYVDKRYYVPSPAGDWSQGKIGRDNTRGEELYIRGILDVCDKEQIDTIFPSFDFTVYLFSKNKDRFEQRGILIPVPDYEVLIRTIDKYESVKVAEKIGFPCPKTFLPRSIHETEAVCDELAYPVILKPRFGSGTGICTIKNRNELARRLGSSSSFPVVQEYIPGDSNQVIYVLMDKNHAPISTFYYRTHRRILPKMLTAPSAAESASLPEISGRVVELLQELRWIGPAFAQMKVDARDGIPKLMEINGRLSQCEWICIEGGVDSPFLTLKVYRDDDVPAVRGYEKGKVFLSPFEDFLALAVYVTNLFSLKVLRRTPLDPSCKLVEPRDLICGYVSSYLAENKAFDYYFRYFFDDPLVSISWWCSILKSTLKNWRAMLI